MAWLGWGEHGGGLFARGEGTHTNQARGKHHTVYVEANEIIGPDGKGTGQYSAKIYVRAVASNSIVVNEEAHGTLESIRERATSLYNREESGAARVAEAGRRAWEQHHGDAGHAGDGFDSSGMGGE